MPGEYRFSCRGALLVNSKSLKAGQLVNTLVPRFPASLPASAKVPSVTRSSVAQSANASLPISSESAFSMPSDVSCAQLPNAALPMARSSPWASIFTSPAMPDSRKAPDPM